MQKFRIDISNTEWIEVAKYGSTWSVSSNIKRGDRCFDATIEGVEILISHLANQGLDFSDEKMQTAIKNAIKEVHFDYDASKVT